MVAPARAGSTGFSPCTMRRVILWKPGSARPGAPIGLRRSTMVNRTPIGALGQRLNVSDTWRGDRHHAARDFSANGPSPALPPRASRGEFVPERHTSATASAPECAHSHAWSCSGLRPATHVTRPAHRALLTAPRHTRYFLPSIRSRRSSAHSGLIPLLAGWLGVPASTLFFVYPNQRIVRFCSSQVMPRYDT